MKKKLIFITLCLTLVLSLCLFTACEDAGGNSVTPSTSGSSGDQVPIKYSEGLEFTLIDNAIINKNGESYLLSGMGTCTDTELVIPNTYESKPVVAIDLYAFRDCSSLTSITIPDSVNFVAYSEGDWTLDSCENLKYNEYDNCLYLGNANNPYLALIKAKDATTITSCTINDKTKVIADYAFVGCSELTSVTISNSVTSIGYCAFDSCSALTNITIPNSVTHIDSVAFCNCSALTNVKIGNGVTYIGPWIFMSCRSLNEIKFDGTVAEWNDIVKDDDWNFNTSVAKVICSDGEVEL